MQNYKTLLITGASGFIGRFITDQAIKRGYTVYAAVRRSTDTSTLRKRDVHIVEFDFHDEQSVQTQLATLPAFNFVIHNAGITRAMNSHDYYEVNYGNTRRLIEGLKASGGLPQKFIYISSIAAQGPVNNITSEQESAFSNPLPLTEYGRSKLAAELFIKKFQGLSYIIFRPTAVYGPGDQDFLKAVKFASRGIDFGVGAKPQKLSFIYVKDLARVIIDALESSYTNRLWFVSDGQHYNHLDFGRAVSKCLNRKVFHVPVPIKLAMLIGSVNEAIEGFTKKPLLIKREKLAELSAANWDYSCENIINDLGFQAEFDLYSGMNETIDWYKKEGWM